MKSRIIIAIALTIALPSLAFAVHAVFGEATTLPLSPAVVTIDFADSAIYSECDSHPVLVEDISGGSGPSLDELSGAAWSPQIGCVVFGGDNFSATIDQNNKLHGYAWNDAIGYIHLDDDANLFSSSLIDNELQGFMWNDLLGYFAFEDGPIVLPTPEGDSVLLDSVRDLLTAANATQDPFVHAGLLKTMKYISQADDILEHTDTFDCTLDVGKNAMLQIVVASNALVRTCESLDCSTDTHIQDSLTHLYDVLAANDVVRPTHLADVDGNVRDWFEKYEICVE